MKCPECAADTYVQDTRGQPDHQWRRRVCTGPARHVFTTTEIAGLPRDVARLDAELAETKARLAAIEPKTDIAKARRRRQYENAKARDMDNLREKWGRSRRRREARREAAETGEPVDAIYARWGVS
jgi:hypothetical protein